MTRRCRGGFYHGGALPFTLRDDDEVGRWLLRTDTIFVLGGGKAERRARLEVTGNRSIGDTVMNERRATNYRLIDGRLEVGYFTCPINALCTPFATGELMPGGFRLQVGLVTFTGLGIYRQAR